MKDSPFSPQTVDNLVEIFRMQRLPHVAAGVEKARMQGIFRFCTGSAKPDSLLHRGTFFHSLHGQKNPRHSRMNAGDFSWNIRLYSAVKVTFEPMT